MASNATTTDHLHSSEKQCRRIFEASLDGLLILGMNGVVVEANPAAAAMYGYSRDEMVGMSGKDIVHPNYHHVFQQFRSKVKATGKFHAESMNVRKNGSAFDVEVRGSLFDYGGRKHLLAVVRDITERKRADEALCKSEGKLNAMLESIGDHMSMMDKDLNILWANRTAKRIFGDDIIGKKCYEVYHGRKEPCRPYPCITLRAFQDGKIHEHETEVTAKDGQTLNFHCTANVALRDEEGTPTAVLEISRDITEHKQREAKLRRVAMIVEQAGEGIAVADLDGKLLSVNHAWAGMHGYKEGIELVGEHLSVCHTDEQVKSDVISFNEQVMRNGHHTGEVGHVRKDGTTFPTEMIVTLLKDHKGEPAGLIGFATDITQRKKAEADIRKARDDYLTVANLTGDIIVRGDAEGRWTFLNDGACAFWGKTREELMGRSFADYLHLRDQEKTAAAFERMKRDELRKGFVDRQKTPKGWRTVEWNAVVILDPEGNFGGFQATGRDITERIRAEEELKSRNQELERFNRLMVGRELRMIELKKEIKELKAKADEETEKDDQPAVDEE